MIYLDMDGVIGDWDTSAQKLFDQPLAEISKSKIWKKIDGEGFKFWADMDLYPWTEEFVQSLRWIDEVVICSTPSLDPRSAAGKLRWLQKLFGRNFRDYVLTPKKHLLAKKRNVLIDDKEKNTDDFSRNGGIGILFPRPWNRMRNRTEDPVAHVIEQLKLIYPANRFPSDQINEEDQDWDWRGNE